MLCPCACDWWESSCFLKVWRSIYVKRVRDYLLWKNEERKCLENSKSSTKLCEVQCFLWMNSVVWIMGKDWTWWPYPLFMLKCLLNIWLGVVAIVAMWKWWENVSEWKRKTGKKNRQKVDLSWSKRVSHTLWRSWSLRIRSWSFCVLLFWLLSITSSFHFCSTILLQKISWILHWWWSWRAK